MLYQQQRTGTRAGSNNKRIKPRAVAFPSGILAEDLRLALTGVTKEGTKESELRREGEGEGVHRSTGAASITKASYFLSPKKNNCRARARAFDVSERGVLPR